jgi:hypothetical protein
MQSPQSAESLDAVLGRFQAWSGSRKAKELTDGVRELSYEDALQSSRYRWQARAETRRTEAPPGKADFVPEPLAFADEAFASDTVSLGTVVSEPYADTVVPVNVPAKESSPCPKIFLNVLAEAVSPAVNSGLLALAVPAGRTERQVSMSLRVAASEQALIKARAAEAGLSASAYLRQCALEMEQLRAQVQHTLAVLERNSRLALSAGEGPVQVPSPGFIARLRRRIFGGSDTRLTLRA